MATPMDTSVVMARVTSMDASIVIATISQWYWDGAGNGAAPGPPFRFPVLERQWKED
jgi:hypothetical protein